MSYGLGVRAVLKSGTDNRKMFHMRIIGLSRCQVAFQIMHILSYEADCSCPCSCSFGPAPALLRSPLDLPLPLLYSRIHHAHPSVCPVFRSFPIMPRCVSQEAQMNGMILFLQRDWSKCQFQVFQVIIDKHLMHIKCILIMIHIIGKPSH